MEKIKIMFLVIILCCPCVVNAATYNIAGESYYVETLKENEEVLEEEKRYQFYKEAKNYSEEYYIEGENPKEYPYQSDQRIVTEPSEYSKTYPEEKEGRIIQNKDIYVYQKRKKTKRIHIKDISGSLHKLRLNEINVYQKNELQNYTPKCLSCKSIENIKDNRKDTSTEFEYTDELVLEFSEDLFLEELSLDIYVSDPIGSDVTSFRIATETSDLDVFTEMTLYTKKENSYKLSFDLKEYMKETNEDVIYSEDLIEDSDYRFLRTYKMYSYQDVKYLYYKLDKEYIDGYYKEKEGYIKDEDRYKTYYKVRYLNKLLLKDDYVITTPNYNIYDMIEDTTVPICDIKVESTIDITKNGIYRVTFIYKEKRIDQYVIVDLIDQIESIEFTSRSDVKKAKKIKNTKTSSHTPKKNLSLLSYILSIWRWNMSKESFDKVCRIGIFFSKINLYWNR